MKWVPVLIATAAIIMACSGAYAGPVAVVPAPDGSVLYIADDSGAIRVLDVASGNVARSLAVPAVPMGLAVSADGARLYVAGGDTPGRLFAVNAADGAVQVDKSFGHTLMSPVLSPDGATLYVCSRFTDTLYALDAASGDPKWNIAIGREPVAAAVTPDGAWLVVANHLPAGASDGAYTASTVRVVNTGTQEVKEIALPNGSTGLRGVAVSPDGAFAYATHILGRYQLPTTQLERGWMNTNALSVVDVAGGALVNTVLLDDVDQGAANPWAVACTADGAQVCVTHAGTHELSVIDRNVLHERLAKVAAGEAVTDVSQTPDDVPNDLAFLVDVRRRIKLEGNGPRALAIVGENAYAPMYFTNSVATVSVKSDRPKVASLSLGETREMTVAQRGEMLFNDAALCFQQWQSCASCHPDSRVDALNWDLLNDGMGNPKNTKSMLLAHQTPPAMSLAVRASAEVAVRAGIRFIQFAVRPEEDAVAIDEYLKSMQPVKSPALVNGAFSPEAERGREIYNQAGCAACHSGPMLTDLKTYNVGTGTGMHAEAGFDTPTLVEVWRTAPYLHDGSAATLEEVFTKRNVGDRHGATSGLSAEQMKDLIAYVRSL